MNISRQHVVFGSTVAVSLLSGGAAGYFIAMKRLETKYAEIAEMEIAEAKAFYSLLHKKEEFETPESTVAHFAQKHDEMAEAAEAILTYQGTNNEVEEEGDPVEIVREQLKNRNIFTDARPDSFDYDSEIPKRSPDKPYIISQEEFLQNEPENDQTTITFFEGDDVLSDERDQPIDEVDTVVGEDNLQQFGYGSNDNNIVYVRNEKLELDFEILRSTGKYTAEVLGFLEHAENRYKVPKFRGDDE